MVQQDTIRLLRECDAGVKMGTDSLDDVIGRARSPELKGVLTASLDEHRKIDGELQSLLDQYGDEGKDPNPVAKGMSWVKTNAMLAADSLNGASPDNTIADLMVDGCNMGVKSLSRYLNQYAAADESSKNLTKRLITLEEQLSKDMRGFL